MLASWDFTSSTVVRFSKERAFFSRGVPPKRLRIEVILAPPPATSTLRRSTSEDSDGIPSTSCSSSVVGDSGLSSGFATSYQERIGATGKNLRTNRRHCYRGRYCWMVEPVVILSGRNTQTSTGQRRRTATGYSIFSSETVLSDSIPDGRERIRVVFDEWEDIKMIR